MRDHTITKLLVPAVLLAAVSFFFGGCATVPRSASLPAYNIGGVSYVSLVPMCESRNVDWNYDAFAKTVTLSQGGHTVSLLVDETLVLVDGREQHLKHPLKLHQGALAVPLRFKEQIFDVYFRPPQSPLQAGSGMRTASLVIKTIVVDAGHGGKDPGAIGRSGTREKDVTLDIAKRLSAALRSQGYRVVMTRSSDVSVSLARRVSIANDAQADLFISVHANANRVRSLNGFEVYYVSPNANDYQRALSSSADIPVSLARYCASAPSSNLKAILWDMILTNNRAESIALGKDICNSTGGAVSARIIGVKGANFYVLKGTRMPAVLVETGFLSNASEEKLLKNGYYRQQIAQAVASGIQNYARNCAPIEAHRR